MAATKIDRIGYGQLEPNHLSAQRTAQIYAQLPAAEDITILENGQFARYDYANGEVNFTGDVEPMLVYNEIKLYDEREQMYKDFALKAEDFTPGSTTITHGGLGPFNGRMYPRLLKTNVGDIFTTNTFAKNNTSNKATVAGPTLKEKDVLKVDADGFLSLTGTSDIEFTVVKVYTLGDGQPAVKVQRTK